MKMEGLDNSHISFLAVAENSNYKIPNLIIIRVWGASGYIGVRSIENIANLFWLCECRSIKEVGFTVFNLNRLTEIT